MIRSLKSRLVLPLVVLSAVALASCSSTGSSSNAGGTRTADPAKTVARVDTAQRTATRTGEVYLMRGLMDIFSRGMDVMAAKLNRSGVYAVSYSYTDWKEMADRIIERDKAGKVSYPVVIMGHSLGANDAAKMATYLGSKGVKVSYVVAFDPTDPGYYGKNIGKVVNYYLPNGDNRVYKTSDFKGSLQNISLAERKPEVTHTTIEKDPSLQGRVIGNILKMTKTKRS